MMPEEEFKVELAFEKSTKRTYRFNEGKEPAKIGTLYVQQHAFSRQPKRIEVTVKVLE